MSEEEKVTGDPKDATEEFLEKLDPKIWERVTSMSPDEQDERWFALTQQHLKQYYATEDAGPEAVATLSEDPEFIDEEKEFLMLNYIEAKNTPVLSAEMPQIGCAYNPEQTKFGKFGDFIGTVSRMIQHKGQFCILVSGAGIVGKATIRKVLAGELLREFPEKEIVSLDRDYQKLPPLRWGGEVNVVEDVHGMDQNESGGLKRFDGSEGISEKGYDVVVYVLPRAYRQSLLNRGISWAEIGKIDLTDPDRLPPEDANLFLREVAGELDETLAKGKKWYEEQLVSIRKLRKNGVPVVIVDPTEYLFALGYIRGKDKDIKTQSFYELLKKYADMEKVKAGIASHRR